MMMTIVVKMIMIMTTIMIMVMPTMMPMMSWWWSSKVAWNINILWWLSCFLPRHDLVTFCNAYIRPSLDNCNVVWHTCSQKASTQLERLQNYARKVILKESRVTSSFWVRERLDWKTLQNRLLSKSLNNMDPATWLSSWLHPPASIATTLEQEWEQVTSSISHEHQPTMGG